MMVNVNWGLQKTDILHPGEETMVGKFLAIQHRLNPLHLYCRFVDRGISRRFSVYLCRTYENLLFIWINQIIKSVIYICIIVGKENGICDELKNDKLR